MRLNEMELYGTTDSDGDLTVNGDAVFGKLDAVQWISGDLAASCTMVLSTQGHDAATASVLAIADSDTDLETDALYYPRSLVHSQAGVALTGTSGGDRTLPLLVGKPRLVIAAGGDKKSGGCILFYFEDQ